MILLLLLLLPSQLLLLTPTHSFSYYSNKKHHHNKNNNNKPTQPPSKITTAWNFRPKISPQECTYSITIGWSLRCTSTNEDDGELLRVDPSKESWKEVCANRCAEIALTPGKVCGGFVFRGPNFNVKSYTNTCIFRQCQGSVVADTNDVTAVVYDSSTCLFTTSPTFLPTTKYPTRKPTPKMSPESTSNPFSIFTNSPNTIIISSTDSPSHGGGAGGGKDTQAPVGKTISPTTSPPIAITPTYKPTSYPTKTNSPTVKPTKPTRPTKPQPTTAPIEEKFTSPTNLPESWPTEMYLFVQDSLQDCYVPRIPPMGATYYSWTNWKGTLKDCVKECQYDPQCFGIQFSQTVKTCTKSTKFDIYDNVDAAAKYLSERWITMHRISMAPTLLYFNSYCATLVWSKECNSEGPRCGWNQGKRGYNQIHAVDRGYCGTMKCEMR
jgi:hypothetical protein